MQSKALQSVLYLVPSTLRLLQPINSCQQHALEDRPRIRTTSSLRSFPRRLSFTNLLMAQHKSRRRPRYDGSHTPENNGVETALAGRGGRIRTSVWRNQNQLDYPTISTRIWKNRPKRALAISMAWQPFPNENGPPQGRINPAKSGAAGKGPHAQQLRCREYLHRPSHHACDARSAGGQRSQGSPRHPAFRYADRVSCGESARRRRIGPNPRSATNDSCVWLNVPFRDWRHSSVCCVAVTPSPQVPCTWLFHEGRIRGSQPPRVRIKSMTWSNRPKARRGPNSPTKRRCWRVIGGDSDTAERRTGYISE
jgi:hypothetical protein